MKKSKEVQRFIIILVVITLAQGFITQASDNLMRMYESEMKMEELEYEKLYLNNEENRSEEAEVPEGHFDEEEMGEDWEEPMIPELESSPQLRSGSMAEPMSLNTETEMRTTPIILKDYYNNSAYYWEELEDRGVYRYLDSNESEGWAYYYDENRDVHIVSLDNCNIQVDGDSGISFYAEVRDVEIVLAGENRISGDGSTNYTSCGIYAQGKTNIKIMGKGTLDVRNENTIDITKGHAIRTNGSLEILTDVQAKNRIYAYDGITISNTVVNVDSNRSEAMMSANGQIVIDNAEVTAIIEREPSEMQVAAIDGGKGVFITDSSVSATGGAWGIYSSKELFIDRSEVIAHGDLMSGIYFSGEGAEIKDSQVDVFGIRHGLWTYSEESFTIDSSDVHIVCEGGSGILSTADLIIDNSRVVIESDITAAVLMRDGASVILGEGMGVGDEGILVDGGKYATYTANGVPVKEDKSNALQKVTFYKMLSAPENFKAVPGNGQVALSWDRVSEEDGEPVIEYQVRWGENKWLDVFNDVSYIGEGLTNGKEYTFSVRAVGDLGPGRTASITAAPNGPVTPPPAPDIWFSKNSPLVIYTDTKDVKVIVSNIQLDAKATLEYGRDAEHWTVFKTDITDKNGEVDVSGLLNETGSLFFRAKQTIYGKEGEYSHIIFIVVVPGDTGIPEKPERTSSSGGSGGSSAYTVYFDANGGTGIVRQTVIKGKTLTKPGDPVKEGYIFTGWYTDKGLTKLYDFTKGLNNGFTLYAGWIAEGAEGIEEIHISENDGRNKEGYISGYPDGTFRPEENMTRAEAVSMIYRGAGYEWENGEQSISEGFKDVNEGEWYYRAVADLSGRGVLQGYPDGTFRPDEPVKRIELLAIAVQISGNTADRLEMNYSDVAPDYWGADYVYKGAAMGLISGYPDGTFRPEELITRAEAVTVMYRMLGLKGPDPGIDRPINFSDVPENHWAYEMITGLAVSEN